MADKTVEYDVDGYEIITEALSALLVQYPALEDDETIRFSTLDEDSGISFYPISGAIVASKTETITGKVNALCNYPFTVVYRTAAGSPDAKVDVKEFLDDLGRWLEQQPITVDDTSYTLTAYPDLTDTSEIEEIKRESPAFLSAVYESGVQDWAINLKVQYRSIYYPNINRRL